MTKNSERDFCFWLSGYLHNRQNNHRSLSEEEYDKIKKELEMSLSTYIVGNKYNNMYSGFSFTDGIIPHS